MEKNEGSSSSWSSWGSWLSTTVVQLNSEYVKPAMDTIVGSVLDEEENDEKTPSEVGTEVLKPAEMEKKSEDKGEVTREGIEEKSDEGGVLQEGVNLVQEKATLEEVSKFATSSLDALEAVGKKTLEVLQNATEGESGSNSTDPSKSKEDEVVIKHVEEDPIVVQEQLGAAHLQALKNISTQCLLDLNNIEVSADTDEELEKLQRILEDEDEEAESEEEVVEVETNQKAKDKQQSFQTLIKQIEEDNKPKEPETDKPQITEEAFEKHVKENLLTLSVCGTEFLLGIAESFMIQLNEAKDKKQVITGGVNQVYWINKIVNQDIIAGMRRITEQYVTKLDELKFDKEMKSRIYLLLSDLIGNVQEAKKQFVPLCKLYIASEKQQPTTTETEEKQDQ